VNVATNELPNLKYVVPGEPANSYLVQKLMGASGISGARMPLISTMRPLRRPQHGLQRARRTIEEVKGELGHSVACPVTQPWIYADGRFETNITFSQYFHVVSRPKGVCTLLVRLHVGVLISRKGKPVVRRGRKASGLQHC